MPLIINDEVVDPSLIDQEFSAIKSYHESLAQVSCCERDAEFMGYAKENIINRFLLAQEAERRGYPVFKREVDAEVARLKAENGGELKLSPEAMKLLRQDVAARVRMEKFIAEVSGPVPEPTEDDLRAYYEAHAEDYRTAEEIRASHIFKSLRKTEGRETLYEKMREVRKRALAGEDFHALALTETDKEPEDIDLGFFKRGEHMEEFEVIAFSLEEGEVSPVFTSHWGFHLCKVTGRKPATLLPLEEVKESIQEAIIQDHRKAALERLAEDLRAQAAIIDEGNEVAAHQHHG